MPFRWNPREHIALGGFVANWMLIAVPVGALVGSAVALFLWSLDKATQTRWDHPWLLFLMPVAGVCIGWMYHLLGKSVEGGNNLIMEQIHEPGGGVPSRMAPLVLIGTVVTHLFGGSAGREGTAVQRSKTLVVDLQPELSIEEGEPNMPHRHKVTSREIGQIRIYMTPKEKRKVAGLKGLFGKPLYMEIIDAAKADGILNAVAHHTHYGYTGNGRIQTNASEMPNPNLNLCIELIADRDQLELFCRKHGELLTGKVIRLQAHGTLGDRRKGDQSLRRFPRGTGCGRDQRGRD